MRVARSIRNKKKLAADDEHFLFRQGLIGLLGEYKEFNVLFEAANGPELVEKFKNQRPDLVLLDIEMPGLNGFETTVAIKREYPEIKIKVLSIHNECEFEAYMMRSGRNAISSKYPGVDTVDDRIKIVSTEGTKTKRMTNASAVNSKKLRTPILSDRETEVLQLLCKEHTNREIGDILNISQRTVDTYRKNIFSKIGARNLAGVVLYAVNNDLVSKR